jgi:hypothetical protein
MKGQLKHLCVNSSHFLSSLRMRCAFASIKKRNDHRKLCMQLVLIIYSNFNTCFQFAGHNDNCIQCWVDSAYCTLVIEQSKPHHENLRYHSGLMSGICLDLHSPCGTVQAHSPAACVCVWGGILPVVIQSIWMPTLQYWWECYVSWQWRG